MKESYGFDNAGVRPIRASDTRWISHKIGAMTRILDKFGLCITYLENVATDTSYRAKEHNQIKGYLNKYKNSKMLVNLCIYLELLKPIMQTSKKKKPIHFLPPLVLEKSKESYTS